MSVVEVPPTGVGSSEQALSRQEVRERCVSIMELLLPHRRAADLDTDIPATAFDEQLRQLAAFVSTGEPILFTLPGFPCKSPNPAKVLGHLPDEGERLSLRFLDQLCVAVKDVYEPGARMLICSDGHVFADLISVPDEHVDAYSDELVAMIAKEELSHLGTFDLRDVYGDMSYQDKRTRLADGYHATEDDLRAETLTNPDTMRLYLGITRFLVDDTAEFSGTKSALQRQCRARAYGVIQRSRAWGELIARRFPRQVRLSIHPQPRGSIKFGIRLLQIKDVWTTPWHSAVLKHGDGEWELMRKTDAERHGRLVLHDGRPSHFEAA
ncbi:MAG: isocyanide synthase family protein [Kutzneria sp.]|nr:isocyanide synthase family protein [Kutzneria sp.]MBV9843592.1 isocyanide synthase family protein [Kutzneria sp.]